MKRKILVGLVPLLLLIGIYLPLQVQASEERIYFGSEHYRWELGAENPIGIHFYAYYWVERLEFEIAYDTEMLEHISGGQSLEPGRIWIQSEFPFTGNFSSMLNFRTQVGGSTSISIQNIEVYFTDADTSEEETISLDGLSAPIHIVAPDLSRLSMIRVDGQDVDGFRYDSFNYHVEVGYEVNSVEITALPYDATIEATIMSDVELGVGINEFIIFTEHLPGSSVRYMLTIYRQADAGTIPEQEIVDAPELDAEEVFIPEATVILTGGGGAEVFRNRMIFAIILLLLILLLLYLISVKTRIVKKRKWQERIERSNARRLAEEERRQSAKEKRIYDYFDEVESFNLVENRKVEIKVMGLTLDYVQEKNEADSLKELFLNVIKRKREIRYLRALDDVTFNIKQGEIVGIIGTNGSGKSTLLKVISGVLPPTAGEVKVNRKKVQLLTLGTGFDGELTGRENVYLNGALIGYSKEYIDERYDEIVEFAELQDFMEEKVKTYSSGMVSRLGFAIATARSAPGVLILDEVLSVGDMHFAKKSKARIKELIHSGSTVIIVSHSLAAIRENCTTAIWLEKSKLMMQGDVRRVCNAYKNKDVQ